MHPLYEEPVGPLPRTQVCAAPSDTALPSVLLVADNPLDTCIAARLLERLGCRVDIVADLFEVLRALEHTRYRLVLLDCEMPRMDGHETVRRLRVREQPDAVRVPVLALTADARPADVERCLAAGMDGILAKPIRLADLRAALARWCPAGTR